MSATRYFADDLARANEAPETLGDDHVVNQRASFAGGARDVAVEWSDEFETEAFKDA